MAHDARLSTQLIKSWTMRFEKEEEADFKASLELDILHGLRIGGFLGLVCWLMVLIPELRRQAAAEDSILMAFTKSAYESCDPRIFAMAWWITAAASSGGMSLLATLRLSRGWFLAWNWELLAVMAALCSGFSLTFANGFHAALLFGEEPNAVWNRDESSDVGGMSQSLVLLGQDLILTLVALYLPIRACVMWVLPVFVLGPYIVLLTCVGCAFPTAVSVTIALISFLAIAAFHGAHRLERDNRQRWLIMREQERQIHETSAQVERQETGIRQRDEEIQELQRCIEEKPDQLTPLSNTAQSRAPKPELNQEQESYLNALQAYYNALQASPFKQWQAKRPKNRIRSHDTDGGATSSDSGSSVGNVNGTGTDASAIINEPDIHHCSVLEPSDSSATQSDDEDLSIHVSFTAVEMELITCSAGFTKLIGLSPRAMDCSFLFCPQDNEDFTSQYRSCVNEFLLDPNGAMDHTKSFQGVLRWKRMPLHYVATCSITLQKQIVDRRSGLKDDNHVVAHAVLCNVFGSSKHTVSM